MNIYFSGSIYGGREKLEDYKKLIKELSKYGEVLNPEVADEGHRTDRTYRSGWPQPQGKRKNQRCRDL